MKENTTPRKLQKLQKNFNRAKTHGKHIRLLNTFEEGDAEISDDVLKPLEQKELLQPLPLILKKQIIDLQLPSGPYKLAFSPNGRYLAFAGTKGSVAVVDCHTMNAPCDVNVKQKCKDITFYHNESMVAVAQEKYTHVYDSKGTEIHVLRDLKYPNALCFLPFHFLLVRTGETGELNYLDVSVGEVVKKLQTRRGPCNVMACNPENAIIYCGHDRGTVTLWSPNSSDPIKILKAQKGRISSIAISPDGQFLASTGLDGVCRIWDNRKLDESACLSKENVLQKSGASLAFSQRNLLAIGESDVVSVWDSSKNRRIYKAVIGRAITDVKFRPFEDLLYFSHEDGLRSMLTPGSSIANFDSFSLNPFETKEEKREKEVRSLLEKIPPEMIDVNHNPQLCT